MHSLNQTVPTYHTCSTSVKLKSLAELEASDNKMLRRSVNACPCPDLLIVLAFCPTPRTVYAMRTPVRLNEARVMSAFLEMRLAAPIRAYGGSPSP